MNNKLLLPLLIVLLLAFAGLWKFAGQAGPDPMGTDMAGLEAGSAAGLAEGQGQELSTPSSSSDQEGGEREQAQRLQPDVMEADSALVKLPSNAVWITGRVIYPDRYPNDMGEVVVTAKGRKFGDSSRREHSATVKNDGTFRVAFSKKTRKGWLSARGRYLYLPDRVALDLSKVPADLVLEPELGGVVRGSLRAPLGMEWSEEAREGAVVNVNRWARGSSTSRGDGVNSGGEFELQALPAGTYSMKVHVPLWADHTQQNVTVRAGEITPLEVPLKAGCSVAGRVVDAEDVPQVGIGVELTGTSEDESRIREFARTNDDGSFHLRGVPEGDLTIITSTDDALPAKQALGFLRDGAARRDVVLRLSDGHSIEGVLRWEDGSPVSGGLVSVAQDREKVSRTMDFSDGVTEQTLPDGTFKITGLESSLCVVRGSAKSFRKEDLEKAAARKLAGKKARRLRPRGPTYMARMDDVAPGTQGLVLILVSGESLSGRVVDDQGEGVSPFMLTASPVAGEGFRDADAVNRLVVAVNGNFTVDGLKEGTWNVKVSADDHETSETVVVTIPGSAKIEMVANRLATVSGVVRGPAGDVISGADVWIRRLKPDEEFTAAVISGSWGEETTTKQSGSFEAKDVRPGRLRVWAKAEGFASSLAQELQVAPGGQLEEVSLRLRPAARIRGQLFSSIQNRDGRVVTVRAQSGGSYWDNVTTDDQGDFEVVGLDAGPYILSLQQSKSPGAPAWQEKEVVVQVDVKTGATVSVVLGSPPENPTSVSGVVYEGERPRSGVVVRCRARHRGDLNNDVAMTGEDGVYSMTLNGPGAYSFEVGDSSRGNLRYERELGAGGNPGVDFHLPTGSVEGVVMGIDGKPQAACQMTLAALGEPELGEEPMRERRLSTDKEGRFLFEHVAPGEYSLRVHDDILSSWQRRQTTQPGTQVVESLKVPEDGKVSGLVFELEEAGEISGEVLLPNGSPAAGATVQVRLPSGITLHSSARVRTNSQGQFTCRGVGVGKVVLVPSLNGEPGEAVTVRVSPGETVETRLEVPAN
ncbi:MAG: hypothetical protein ACI9F9_003271, partial [Candidatus Paceibacteria bacterium]